MLTDENYYFLLHRLDKSKPYDLKWCGRYTAIIMKWLVACNPFLHKLGKFYVNIKTKEITIEIHKKHIKLINDKINDDSIERIKKILAK